MPRKPRKRKTNGKSQPVEYKSYFVLSDGRDPALAEASAYYNHLKNKKLIKAAWVKQAGGPSATTVRRYTSTEGKFTKRPNATTFFAFLATLPGVKGYDIRKKLLIIGE